MSKDRRKLFQEIVAHLALIPISSDIIINYRTPILYPITMYRKDLKEIDIKLIQILTSCVFTKDKMTIKIVHARDRHGNNNNDSKHNQYTLETVELFRWMFDTNMNYLHRIITQREIIEIGMALPKGREPAQNIIFGYQSDGRLIADPETRFSS